MLRRGRPFPSVLCGPSPTLTGVAARPPRRRPARPRPTGPLAAARRSWGRLPGRARRLVAAAVLVVAVVVVLVLVVGRGGGTRSPSAGSVSPGRPEGTGLLRYDPARRSAYEGDAASGLAHVVYARSPGGVVATARRVLAYEADARAATKGTGVSADDVLAIVFLESAGRPDVIAGSDPANAAGLGQILAATATEFLGMRVDLPRSRALTTRIAAGGDVAATLAERRTIDDRFDPRKAIAGIVRYLQLARGTFGRSDLAIESYHMGVGNLTSVLGDFAGTPLDSRTVAAAVARNDLSWARVFFASSPVTHAAAWGRLAAFADDSVDYAWKVRACREILAAYRSDPAGLARIASLQTGRASAELALHPPATTPRFPTTSSLLAAWRAGVLVPLASGRRYRIDRQMGSLAGRFGLPRSRFRGLRPRALATLGDLTALAARVSGDATPLVVTSSVRDDPYQELLRRTNAEATHGVSLHTTGYAFDLARAYHSPAQARGMQFALDRMQALNLIAWVREPAAIHVTVR